MPGIAPETGLRILVAMSGGVDSSMAAALLKEQGHDVTGAVMRLFDGSGAPEAARAMADFLGIPCVTMDYRDEFEQEIKRDYISEYLGGRTPNPCVRCNRQMKFGRLAQWAFENGFDRFATGHYVRTGLNHPLGNVPLIRKGKDTARDQSYFLYAIDRSFLPRLLFPLGDLTKTEVRRMAFLRCLPAADSPDSQEVCFIPENDHAGFIDQYLDLHKENMPMPPDPSGTFLDIHGNRVGEYLRYYRYTVGQRRNLGISLGRRRYVLRISPERRTIILADEDDLWTDRITAYDLKLHADREELLASPVLAKIRSRAPEVEAIVTACPNSSGRIRVCFRQPVRAPAPGQSVVFYRDGWLLGGAIIEDDEDDDEDVNKAGFPTNNCAK